MLVLCCSCSSSYDSKGMTPLVEIDGNFLYRENLEAVMPAGLTKEDSLLFVGNYIHNWVEETLLFEKAQANIPDNEQIEALVESYRKSLIVHTYKQELIKEQLVSEISEKEMHQYYDEHKDLFTLSQPLIQGLFIKVPYTAPKLKSVREWYKKNDREAVENLEKYSLQNAVKYEYFYNKWVAAADVIDLLPSNSLSLEQLTQTKTAYELKDTAYYYFLNVSDIYRVGEQEPYEHAGAKLREILINLKQVDFIKNMKADLYQDAVKNKRIKYNY